jgi:hypothetical protein
LVSSLTIAGGATLAGLLGLLRLQHRHHIVRQAASIAIGGLCATIVAVLWTEPDSDWWIRVIGIESVIVAALTLALPAIARFLPPEGPGSEVSISYCPACASSVRTLPGKTDHYACTACGLRFGVSVDHSDAGPPPPGDNT